MVEPVTSPKPLDPASSSPFKGVRGLYAIADADAAERVGLGLMDCARAMMAGGASVLQLRAKGRDAGQVHGWLEELASTLPSQGGPLLVINDRADLARLVPGTAVHVGQDDLPPSDVLRVAPGAPVGLSTHNVEQLTSALALPDLHYVALGPIFPTSSKKNPDPVVGLTALAECHRLAQARGIPLVAIGGVNLENLPQVAQHAEMVAAISLLLPQVGTAEPYSWIEQRTRALSEQICSQTAG